MVNPSPQVTDNMSTNLINRRNILELLFVHTEIAVVFIQNIRFRRNLDETLHQYSRHPLCNFDFALFKLLRAKFSSSSTLANGGNTSDEGLCPGKHPRLTETLSIFERWLSNVIYGSSCVKRNATEKKDLRILPTSCWTM
jgi:hypothetical protein